MKTIKLIDENLVGQPGLSRYVDPKVGWVREVNDYDCAVYVDRMCFISEIDTSKNNYAWIIEPPIINGENYTNIMRQKDKFKNVFTHIRNFVSEDNNVVYVPHGGTWLREEDINIFEKTKNVSFIFSYKDWNPYHRMRHRVYERFKDNSEVDFFGTGCNNPIDYKIEGLKDYRFSIIIENSIEDLYFTEKLLDCFLSGTIPIYVGCKKVLEFFDENGIVFFDGDEDLPEILSSLNEVFYNSKLDSIQRNFEVAKNYIHPERFINDFINNNV